MEPCETSEARSIVFVHVPRTAGSSTHGAFQAPCLRRWFVTDRVENLARICDDVRRSLGQGVYVGGHFSLADVERYLPLDVSRTVNFTVVREPVERVVSLYHYILANPSSNPPIYNAIVGKDMDYFVEFMRSSFPDMVCNSQCLQISGSANASEAIKALHERFDFAATLDRIDDMVTLVWLASNQSGAGQAPAFKDWVNAARRSKEPSAEARDLMTALNQEDARLFDFMGKHGGLFRSARHEGASGMQVVCRKS